MARTTRRVVAILLTAAAVTGFAADSASAWDGTVTSSCSTNYFKNIVTLTGGGTMSVKQRSSTENTNQLYWAVSSNGNAVSRKATTDGGTVSWTSVASGTYTFKTTIAFNKNCNGALPGNGNTNLALTVTP